jgi:hypothetical protein
VGAVVVVVVGAVVVVVVGAVVVVVELVVTGGVASSSESPHPAARITRTARSAATRSRVTGASSRQSRKLTRPPD